MNLLVPDSWLRDFLKTHASPEQIKEYVSQCGPSVERINSVQGEIIYEIEVTSNRPDSMSVFGIAREAAAILPRFGVEAELVNDQYQNKLRTQNSELRTKGLRLNIKTNPQLNPRWTSVVLDQVKVKPSPAWFQKRLKQTGIRPLNSVIDITNYLMRAYGQPAHAFDYDRINPDRNGVPAMILRASRKGEKIVTLDGIKHILAGNDIVIEDGTGRLIDLCGIMGADNSNIRESTTRVVLFMQTYNPVNIRRTSMSLAHRTEAAQLFEKGLDSEQVLPAVFKGVELMEELSDGRVASQLYDVYPNPYQPKSVTLIRKKLDAYLGTELPDREIRPILASLGLVNRVTRNSITVTVPSFRQDIKADVDVIEEITRIYGYHNVAATLPDMAPPMGQTDTHLAWEEEVKVRLRNWGFTEIYSYSMISEELVDTYQLDKEKTYKIANPLSHEWVYLRPSSWPSVLKVVQQNINHREKFELFELSMRYRYRQSNIPSEEPVLMVVWTGSEFLRAKGLAEALFDLFGIPFPDMDSKSKPLDWYDHRRLSLGKYGSLGVVNRQFLQIVQIKSPLTVLELEFNELVNNAHASKRYTPIPRYPPVIEDMTFVLPVKTSVGPIINLVTSLSRLIHRVEIRDRYKDAVTLRIHYVNPEASLTDREVGKIRNIIKVTVEQKFSARLKA